ncbi:MAG: starch-binding protein [Ruminococcus sp.]|nr:starch-binding protein [Ruminococcus sp.]
MKSMTRRSLAVVLAILMVFSTMMVGMITTSAATTVYFVNSDNWSKVNGYAWTNGGEMAWPGTAATLVDSANKVYSYDAGSYTKVIFNDGSGNQTSDLTIDAAKPYYQPKTGLWYATKDEAITAAGSAVSYEWYVCGTLGGNNWTLKQANMGMTKQTDGSYTKVFENVDAGSYKYKVNNGTWDTAYPSSDKTVTVATSGSTVTVKLSGTTVTDTVVAPAAPSSQPASSQAASSQAASSEAPVETITILYTDTLNWDKVNVHYWNAAGLTSKWPGVEMTFKGTNDFQQKQYTAEIPAAAEKMIFNNGTDQLGEVAVDATATGYYYDADAQAVKTWTEEPASSQPASSEPASSEPASSEPVVGASTFYVVGSFTDWQTDDAYKLTKNTAAEVTEYSISGLELKKDDEFKVVETNGSIQGFNPVWYPDGIDNNYVVAEDGTYTVYFRPDYNGGEDWFNSCIYAAKEETPQPTVKKIRGDVNGDKQITSTDLILMKRYFAEYEDTVFDIDAADVNGDNQVTSTDLILAKRYFAEYEDTACKIGEEFEVPAVAS